MSLSPTEQAPARLEDYTSGWVAIYRLMRQGLSWSGRERHCAFLNLGHGRFADASPVSGLDVLDDGRAAARLDWDQDGAPDLLVTSRQGPMLRLMRNRGAGPWLALRLAGAPRNRDGVGARVELRTADGRVLVDSVRAGEGYLAQSSPWLFFGLGDDARVASVRVRWPGGDWEAFEGVEGPGRWRLALGSGRAEPLPAPDRVALSERALPQAEASSRGRSVLAAPLPLQGLAGSADGEPVPLVDPEGRPTLVVLWAEWCAPCADELARLAAPAGAQALAGVRVLALDADPAAGGTRLADLDWPHAAADADEALLDALDALQQSVFERRHRLALPTSLLVDGGGHLLALYRGAVEPSVVAADAGLAQLSPEERRAAAVPFPGRWMAPPPQPDLARAARFLGEAGLDDLARVYDTLGFEVRSTTPARIQLEFGNARARAGQVAQAVEHFRAATELEPDLQVAWSSLATALHETGRVDEAIEAYVRALDLDGRDTAARYNLALALAARGDAEGAARELETLRVVDPAQARELQAALGRLGLR